jgi:hypothetical protein
MESSNDGPGHSLAVRPSVTTRSVALRTETRTGHFPRWERTPEHAVVKQRGASETESQDLEARRRRPRASRRNLRTPIGYGQEPTPGLLPSSPVRPVHRAVATSRLAPRVAGPSLPVGEPPPTASPDHLAVETTCRRPFLFFTIRPTSRAHPSSAALICGT